MKEKYTNQLPVCQGVIDKISGVNMDASVCAYSLGEVSGVLT